VTEEKTSESEGVISESEARKNPKTSVTEGKLFTDPGCEPGCVHTMNTCPTCLWSTFLMNNSTHTETAGTMCAFEFLYKKV
jgi:hypothetical protein